MKTSVFGSCIFLCCLIFLGGGYIFVTQANSFGFGLGYDNIDARKEVNVGGVDEDQGEDIMDLVKNIVNRALGIMGLIAIVIFVYGGLRMILSVGNDDGYERGRMIMKNAILGIVFIGIARFVISLIFWAIVVFSENAGAANSLE